MRGLQGNLQTAGFTDEALLAPEQALTLFFSHAQLRPPQTERVTLDLALGRVLARDAIAEHAFPVSARSAMDGFALRAADTPGTLPIGGEIRIGELPPELPSGGALRIPTGGVLPAGADCVVPIEDTEIGNGTVTIGEKIAPGDCVVPAGSDMRAGETILARGRRIDAAALGVLATLGIADVDVFKQPLFAIVSSGDELVDVRTRPDAAQVRDSNRWAIAGKLQSLGAAVTHFPIAPDEEAAYEKLLRAATAECDGVVLSGGSSVGERDLTARLADRLGEPGVIVHGLRIKPGKPTVLASAGGKPIIGLPGNPTSALMVIEEIGSPIVAQLAGARLSRSTVDAKLQTAIRKRVGWTQFVPVRLEETAGDCVAHPFEMRSSSVSLLARANGFVTLGEAIETVGAGETVTVTRFWNGAV